jgi:hypothetical protein
MNLAGLEAVAIDYEAPDLPASVKEFRPAVFKDGPWVCVLLGPDSQAGIFGCGDVAVSEWLNW